MAQEDCSKIGSKSFGRVVRTGNGSVFVLGVKFGSAYQGESITAVSSSIASYQKFL